MDDNVNNQDRSPPLNNFNEQRRVERLIRQHESVVPRAFIPDIPLQVESQYTEPQADQPNDQVQNSATSEIFPRHREQCEPTALSSNESTIFQPFRPLFPRHREQCEPTPSSSNESKVFQSFRPRFPRHREQRDDSSSTSNESVVFQPFQPIFPHYREQCEATASSSNESTIFQPFRPVFPRHREQCETNSSTSDKSAVLQSFQPVFPCHREQCETGDSGFNKRINLPEQRDFLVVNEDTRMSFTTDNEPHILNFTETDASTSWQRNLGILDIDFTTVSDNFVNDQPMDVVSEDNNAPQEDCLHSPIPLKRHKISETGEKRIDFVREPQPSTSKQADLNELGQLEKSEFKLPQEPTRKRKTNSSKNVKAETSEKLQETENQSKFTIKTGFNATFCPDKDLRELIIDKTKLLSRMFILITIFVNFALRHPEKDYLRNLWSLNGPDYLSISYLFKKNLGKTKKGEILETLNREFVPEFTEYMGRPLEKFDCTNLTSLIQETASQLNVNFKTNLTYHARSRLANFFKFELLKNSKVKKDKSFDERREKQIVKRKAIKDKRKKKNKKKRSRWEKKKKRKKLLGKQLRAARHAALLKTYPDIKKRDKVIFHQVRDKGRNSRTFQRKLVYDATNTTCRNRGKKKKKETIRKRKSKNSSCDYDDDEKDNDDDGEKIEIEVDKKYKIIQELVNDLIIYNECENESMKIINEENLDFRDIVKQKECHKFLNFFHRLQLYLAKNKCKSFNLVPVMKPGLKYITLTNTGLIELERELNKKKGNTWSSSESVPVKHDGLSRVNLRKKIAFEEENHRNKMAPLKEKFNSLSNQCKIVNRQIQAIKKDPRNDTENQLSNLEIELKKVKEELNSVNVDKKKLINAHDEILKERHKNKYNENSHRWARLFNVSNLRINKEKLQFSGTIMTDSVGVSVIYNLIKPKKQINFSISKNPVLNEELKNFDILKGLDPGLKFSFGGVERKVNGNFDINAVDKHVKIKSSSFRWLTGQNRRREILYKYGSKNYCQDLLNTEEFKEKVNNKDARFIITTTKFLLKSFYYNQPFLEQRKVAALKWDKYMSVQRETDLLANYIIGDRKKKQLIVVGQPDIPPWLKGHVRISLRKVVKRLIEEQRKLKNLTVVFVNEHRTTVMCSRCNVRVKIFRNRTTYCSTCRTRWNRDINAGRNILNLGLVKTGLIAKECLPHWYMFNAIANMAD